MSITDTTFNASLIEQLIAAQAASVREPATLQVRFLNGHDEEIRSMAFVYDPKYTGHYLKQAERIARDHDVWADRVSFTLLNRDGNPIVSATYRRFSIPTKWMF